MTEKKLTLKLEIDTSAGAKLTQFTQQQDANIAKLSSSTERLATIEKDRQKILEQVKSAYDRTLEVIERANQRIAEGGKGANLAANTAQASVTALNAKYENQLRLLAQLNSEKAKVGIIAANFGYQDVNKLAKEAELQAKIANSRAEVEAKETAKRIVAIQISRDIELANAAKASAERQLAIAIQFDKQLEAEKIASANRIKEINRQRDEAKQAYETEKAKQSIYVPAPIKSTEELDRLRAFRIVQIETQAAEALITAKDKRDAILANKRDATYARDLAAEREYQNALLNIRKDAAAKIEGAKTSNVAPKQSSGYNFAASGEVRAKEELVALQRLEAQRLQILQKARAEELAIELATANERKRIQESRNTVANNYAKETQAIQTALNNRLTMEESIRRTDADSMQTIALQASQKEEAIRKAHADKLLLIEQQLRDGLITVAAAKYRTNLHTDTTQAEINAIRNVLKATQDAEAQKQQLHAQTVAKFNADLDNQIAHVKSNIAIQTAEQVHGINSIQAIRVRAAEELRQIELRLQAQRTAISASVSAGHITPNVGAGLAAQATARYTAEVNANTTALRANEAALASHNAWQRSIIVRAIEFIGIYRVLNTVLNTVSTSIRAIPDIGIQLESTKASLTATANSAAAMTAIMESLNKEADRTGITISTLRETFRGFQASTSLAGESLDTTWRIFTNLNTVITGLHLSADKASGIFLAMAQIFNKNKVQSEELVKQLGNLLPGAFAAFAKANEGMFKSSEDLIAKMKKGVVFAHETVDNFARYMADRFAPSFALASRGLNAEIGRMHTAFTELGEAIYGLTSGGLLEATKQMTSFANSLRDAANGSTDLGKALNFIGVALGGIAIGSIATLVLGLRSIGGAMAALTGTPGLLARVGAGVAALAVTVKNAFFGPTAIIAAFVTAAYYTHKWATSLTEDQKQIDKTLEDIGAKVKEIKPEPISIQVDKDPFIKEIEASILKARRLISDFQLAIKRGQTVVAVDGNLKSVHDQLALTEGKLKVLKDALLEQRKIVQEKIELNLDTNQALKDLSDVREKIEILFLQATGKTQEAAKKQFEVSHREELALIDAQIELLEKSRTKWEEVISKGVSKTRVIPKEIQEYKDAEEGLAKLKADIETRKQYEVALANAGVNTAKTLNNAYDILTTNLKGYIRDLTSEAKKNIADINFALESARNLSEIGVLQGKAQPGSEKQLVDQASIVKINTLKEELRIVNLIIDKQRTAQIDQKVYAKDTINSIEEAWKKIAKLESGGIAKPATALSPTGALGKFQIQPSTLQQYLKAPETNATLALEKKAKELNKQGLKLSTADQQVLKDFALKYELEINSAAFKYYKSLVKQFDGNFAKAAAAYHSGPNNKALKQDNFVEGLGPQGQDYVRKFSQGNNVKGIKAETDLSNDLTANLEKQYEFNQKIVLAEQERIKANLQLNETTNEATINLQAQVFEAQGNTKAAESLRLMLQYKQQYNELAVKGNNIDLRLLDQLITRKQIEIDLADIEKRTQIASTIYSNTEKRIQAEVLAGSITQLEAGKQLIQAKSQIVIALNEQLKAEEKVLQNNKDDANVLLHILELKGKIADLTQPSGVSQQLKNESLDFIMPGASGLMNTYSQQLNQSNSDKENEITATQTLYDKKLLIAEDYHVKLLEIEERYKTQSSAITLSLYGGMAGVAANAFEGITSNMIKMYGIQSTQARIAFTAYKAFKIAEIVIETAAAVLKSYSSGAAVPFVGPITTGPAYAAIAAAMGAVQIAAIVAQPMPSAHGGLDNVPKEQTYLLDRGERVLSPNQNKQLTSYLNEKKAVSSMNQQKEPRITVVNAVDTSSLDNYLSSDSSERIIRNVIRQTG